MRSLSFHLWVVLLVGALGGGCASVDSSNPRPPKPFRSDGCSLFPDGDYRDCCEQHDLTYWCGGTRAQRRLADQELAQCVADRGHTGLSQLIRAGVVIGGVPWLPLPWRWGFGWPFGRGYTDQLQVQCEIHD